MKKLLAELLAKYGTKTAVAVQLQTSLTALRNYELGLVQKPSNDVIRRIAAALERDFMEVLEEVENAV